MRGWGLVLAVGAGCAESEAGPDLVSLLDGAWTGDLVEASLARSEVVLLVGPTGDSFAHVHIWEDDGPRDYTLDEADSVEDLGVVLDLFEVGGVRRLVLSMIVPFDPLVAGWNASWYCDEEPDRECEQVGIVNFERIEP